MDALRDAKVVWPPDATCEGLRNVQHVEFGGSTAAVMATAILAISRRRLARLTSQENS
jgi:hypothetical protein